MEWLGIPYYDWVLVGFILFAVASGAILVAITAREGIVAAQAELAQRQKLEKDAADKAERDAETQQQVQVCCNRHWNGVVTRLRRLGMPDEYGVWPDKAIEREAMHFFENVLWFETNVQDGNALEIAEWQNEMSDFFRRAYDVMAKETVAPKVRNDGLSYERIVGAEFARQGFAVSYTPRTGDQGVDLVATKGETTIAVQCKDYSGSVGNDAVQQIYAGASFYRATEAVVIAPVPFTASARTLAVQLNVAVLHHVEIATRYGIDKPMAEARQG